MSGTGAGIIILSILILLVFGQVSLLVLRGKQRHAELLKRLEDIEKKIT